MQTPPIFEQFSSLKDRVPWIPLGRFPTPVQRLHNLESQLDLSALWIKRDDVSGDCYGGNKVRCLEFCLADAQQKKAELVFAYSALGSNWPLACVIYAKILGLPSHVFFLPYPLDDIKKKNLEITRKLANRVISARRLWTFPFLIFSSLLKEKRRARVYLTPAGGVSPLTTIGYVSAALELAKQAENGEMPVPDVIYCPLGSGGTAAGISIGLSLMGWKTKVIAVRVVDYPVANRFTLNRLVNRTLKVLSQNQARMPDRPWGRNIIIEHKHFGRGYGRPTQLGTEGIELFRQSEKLVLDVTYTGKAFGALLEHARQNQLAGKVVLFWQTLNSRALDNLDDSMARSREQILTASL